MDRAGRDYIESLIRKTLQSVRTGPVSLILLLQIPVVFFAWTKGGGRIYLDMVGILVLGTFILCLFTTAVGGNQKILFYSLILMTVGMMIKSLFLAEAYAGAGLGKDYSRAAGSLQVQYLTALLAAFAIGWLYHRCGSVVSVRICRLMFAGWVLLSMAALAGSHAVGGARNWIRIGFLSVQTTELIKVIYILAAASLLGTGKKVKRRQIISFYLISAMILVILAAQGEFGTFVLMGLLFFTILILCIPSLKLIGATAFAGAASVGLMVLIARGMSAERAAGSAFFNGGPAGAFLAGYDKIANRFIYWLHPQRDPQGLGYQLLKARESILLGGWFGTSSITDLPVHTSDLVYPALIERCGLVFALLVFVVFVLIWLEGIRAGVRKEDRCHRIVCAATAFLLFDQSLIIICGSTGLCPLTGITLPLISSGGTSLVVSLSLIVLMISASGQVRWKGEEIEQEGFFEKGTVSAEFYTDSGYPDPSFSCQDIRHPARRLKSGRPAESRGQKKGVSERIYPWQYLRQGRQ